jgi:hypothetical protein
VQLYEFQASRKTRIHLPPKTFEDALLDLTNRSSPKHVELRHRTLLFSARYRSGSCVRALVNPTYLQTETLPTLSMR